MILIGISGKKESGKDTIADMCIRRYIEATGNRNAQKIAFADGLYREVAKAIFPFINLESTYQEKIRWIKAHKDNFRLILQGWGTNLRRQLYGDDYWIRQWHLAIQYLPAKALVLVPDVRFQNEFDSIKKLGGLVWRVNRPTCIQDEHASECDLDDCKEFNRIITNDGTLEELEAKVGGLMMEVLTQIK